MAEDRGWKRNEALLIAVVAGVLSLVAASVGSWVGGRTANDGAKQIQDAQNRREDEREIAAARAAARILIAELRGVEGYAQACLASQPPVFVHSYPEALRVDLPRDDRALLASRLSTPAWDAVTTAIVAASFVDSRARQFGMVADLDPGQRGVIQRRLARQHRGQVRDAVEAFIPQLRDQAGAVRAGIAALQPLAGGRSG